MHLERLARHAYPIAALVWLTAAAHAGSHAADETPRLLLHWPTDDYVGPCTEGFVPETCGDMDPNTRYSGPFFNGWTLAALDLPEHLASYEPPIRELWFGIEYDGIFFDQVCRVDELVGTDGIEAPPWPESGSGVTLRYAAPILDDDGDGLVPIWGMTFQPHSQDPAGDARLRIVPHPVRETVGFVGGDGNEYLICEDVLPILDLQLSETDPTGNGTNRCEAGCATPVRSTSWARIRSAYRVPQ